jgi:hypothetical protein
MTKAMWQYVQLHARLSRAPSQPQDCLRLSVPTFIPTFTQEAMHDAAHAEEEMTATRTGGP